VAVLAVAVPLGVVGAVIGAARPAAAASASRLCNGYAACSVSSYTTHGYPSHSSSSYWRMDPGDECTNYTAFVESQTYGVATPAYVLGNGGDWATNARLHGVLVNTIPTVGSVAEWNGDEAGIGPEGHVAVVERVGAHGSYIVVSQQHVMADANGYDWEQIDAGSNSWEPWPDNFIHFSPSGGGAGTPPLIGVLTTTPGEVLVKQGGLSARWTDEFGSGVSQLAVASDPGHGALIGILTTSGEVLVKQGRLGARWTEEFTGVKQVAVASDSEHGALVAVLTRAGEVLVKQGRLTARWVDEYGAGVTQVAVASESAHGPLISVVTPSGEALGKEGRLTAAWTGEYGEVSQSAVASDPRYGPLIAVLATSREALAKEGRLPARWTSEYAGVAQLGVAG